MEVRSNVWFSNQMDGYFGKGRIELLEQIHLTGSISQAAKAMKMSYKAAWDAINEMNRLSEAPIVERVTGGKGGGGTVLTSKGLEYIKIYKKLDEVQQLFFSSLGQFANDSERLERFTSKLTLRTSARNQLLGKVTAIRCVDHRAVVSVLLSEEVQVMVHITAKSLHELAIKVGQPITLLIKPSWITLHQSNLDQNEGQNALLGRIEQIDQEAQSSEVTLRITEDQELIVSLSTVECRMLGLTLGEELWAVFDPSNALLAL